MFLDDISSSCKSVDVRGREIFGESIYGGKVFHIRSHWRAVRARGKDRGKENMEAVLMCGV